MKLAPPTPTPPDKQILFFKLQYVSAILTVDKELPRYGSGNMGILITQEQIFNDYQEIDLDPEMNMVMSFPHNYCAISVLY